MVILQVLDGGELLIGGERFFNFVTRLGVNVASIFILIRFIYYPNNSRNQYLFTFFLMGMMIFLIASILDQVNLNMGFALGLFAIFGIVRYRSPSIDLKEMTYLFIVIGISTINALVEFFVAEWIGLLIVNIIILVSTVVMEKYKPKNHIMKRMMVVSPSDYAVLNNNERLLQEVREITGIDILKVEIVKMNKVKNEISVWVFFNGNNEDYKLTSEEPQEPQSENVYWESDNTSEY